MPTETILEEEIKVRKIHSGKMLKIENYFIQCTCTDIVLGKGVNHDVVSIQIRATVMPKY